MEKSSQKKRQVVIIDGKALADDILFYLKGRIGRSGITPGLAVILIGDDPSSKLYVKNKEKASHRVGIDFHKYLCNKDCFEDISEKEIIQMIEFLNNDPKIHGIIVQLPLPKQYSTQKIINAVDPKKDADGFHPKNIKNLLSGKPTIIPPLIKTILHIIASQNMSVSGKKIVILSHSDIFSQAITKVLKDMGADAQTIDINDINLQDKLHSADIIVPIAGKPHCIKGDMIKKGAFLIDVGITQTDTGFQGDVDLESIKKVAAFATPTPGGVGPITVAMLLSSVYELARKNH